MRFISSLCFFILVPLTVLCQELPGTFEAVSRNGVYEIKLEYSLSREGSDKAKSKDTSGQKARNVFEEHFGKEKVSVRKAEGKFSSGIKTDLIGLLENNPDIELLMDYPAYIIEMSELAKSKKDKQQALLIYRNNNRGSLVQDATSNSMSYQQGNWTKKDVFTFTFKVKPKKETILQIPAYIFRYDDFDFPTKSLSIPLSIF